MVTAEVDVRDGDALAAAVADGAVRLGGVDIELANAGIGIMDAAADPRQAFLREPVRRRDPHGAQPGRRGALRRR